MPNPLFLEVMGITIHEYNAYSPAKKARFQKVATAKLAEVHENDIEAYVQLTKDAVKSAETKATEDAESELEDKENS
jgi:hypothetical protein